MILTFDLSHNNNGLTKTALYPRSLSIIETVTYDIKEISGWEAPVAVEWEAIPGNWLAIHGDEPRATRWFAGRHFRECAVPEVGSDSAALFELVRSGCGNIQGLTRGYMDASDFGAIRLGDRRIKELDEAARTTALASAAQWAEDCIVIDGRVFLACGTPRLLISQTGAEITTKHAARTTRRGPARRPHEADPRHCFENHHFDLKDAQVATEAGALWYGEQAGVHAAFDIHIPESLPTSPTWPRLREAAAAIMSKIDEQGIAKTDPAVLRSLTPIAEIMWRDDEDDMDNLADSIQEICATARAADRSGREFTKTFLAIMESSVSRHYDAEISLDLLETRNPTP